MHYESHKTVVEQLRDRIDTMRKSLDYDTKLSERQELQDQMNETDFWNSPEKAQEVIVK